MLIKNKFFYFIFFLIFSINLNAEEFNITAKEIIIAKDNQVLTGKGSVKATDSEGKYIYADKIIYEKLNEFLIAEGNVKIEDNEGNILITEKASYDKINEKIITVGNTQLLLHKNYKVLSRNINYDTEKKILSSNQPSVFTDSDGNVIETSMFQYQVDKNLFSSIGKIKITDINKNIYSFKELHVDTLKKEMIGSDVSVLLDQNNFGVSEESDPRFAANSIFMSKEKSILSKGIFTVCKKRDEKCPPWILKAEEITHDNIKKTIHYSNATLKVYNIPIFYFPKFFHPDPTVKRQSGFLSPFFTNTSSVGTGFALPYYWVINNDKDLTFTPKIYAKENILLLNEYRQAFRNGLLTLDSSYTKGYKTTSSTKTSGSRNHIFGNLDLNFNENDSYESNLSLQVQRTSNDTYFRIHDINTALVKSENTDLKSEIQYNLNKENMYLSINASMYENLREKTNSRYEYILPNILYGKTFFTDNFGTLDIKSNAFYNNYGTNKHKTFLTNDVMWSPSSLVTKKGFVNTTQGMLRNTNYETKRTNDYRDDGTIHELNAVISHKTSLPMKKEGINYYNLFSPNLMVRYAPGHMRNLNTKDVSLNYSNLYALNKTNEIEEGLSAILGFDFKISEKDREKNKNEKFSLSLGQVFNAEKSEDMPTKSSLDQRMSDVVGEMNYNFSEIGEIDYKFSVDHNLNELNYNEISTQLNFGKVEFNLDYLEQRKHIGEEHYASSGISLNLNNSNKLSLSTKRNFKTESTELYDISYQYAIDCLTAGLVYRREFYQDVDDLEPKDSLMFTLTFIPFTSVTAPVPGQ